MDGHELKRNFQADFQAELIDSSGDRNEVVRDRLTVFVAVYNEAVCDILTSRNDNVSALHADQVNRVQITKASDGFFVAYYPDHEYVHGPKGTYYADLSKHDLNTVCQWLTARMLRIRYPVLGKPYIPLGFRQSCPVSSLSF